MPIYEYKCKDCGEVTERISLVTPAPQVIDCLTCGGASPMIPSTFSFTIPGFKGGQYITEDTLLEGK